MSFIGDMRDSRGILSLPGLANRSFTLRWLWTGMNLISDIVVAIFKLIMGSIVFPIFFIIDILSLPFRIDYNNFYKKYFPLKYQKKRLNYIKSRIRRIDDSPHILYKLRYFDEKDLTYMDLEQFIYEFINVYRKEYFTIDVITGRTVCDKYRRRSLYDIFHICKYYYKDCTVEEVLTILINFLLKKEIYGGFCNATLKFMFHNDSTHFGKRDGTEYGKDRNDIKIKELIEVYGK